MAKKKRKRSAKQKANDERLSQGLKPKKQTTKRKKSKSTRKGQKRKTVSKRRAYEGLKKRVSRRKKSSDNAWNF